LEGCKEGWAIIYAFAIDSSFIGSSFDFRYIPIYGIIIAFRRTLHPSYPHKIASYNGIK